MNLRGWDTACSVCAAGVSVVCMSSMAAALAAAGAAAGAGAASVAGMGSMTAMANDPASGTPLSLLPSLLERAGLGLLNQLPNEVLQPLLVVVLTVTVGASYLAYRGHRRPQAMVLTAISAVVTYLSIYAWMSDPLYLFSLLGLVAGGLWGLVLACRPAGVGEAASP